MDTNKPFSFNFFKIKALYPTSFLPVLDPPHSCKSHRVWPRAFCDQSVLFIPSKTKTLRHLPGSGTCLMVSSGRHLHCLAARRFCGTGGEILGREIICPAAAKRQGFQADHLQGRALAREPGRGPAHQACLAPGDRPAAPRPASGRGGRKAHAWAWER